MCIRDRYKHFFDGIFRKIRIEGLLACFIEGVKCKHELLVGISFFTNNFDKHMSKFRDALLKLFRSFFPLGYFRGAIFKEELKDFNELSGIGNISIKEEIVILV